MIPDSAASRPKKVAGIILAAGCGSRMGKAKQLLPFDGTTLLGRVLNTVQDAGLDSVVLVLGFEAGRICHALDLIHSNEICQNQTCLENQTCPDRTGIRVVNNPDWHKGQSFSVAAGLKALSAEISGALFLLGDQPLVKARTIRYLISAFQTTDYWILAPCFNGQRGNPVLVASRIFGRLSHPVGDAGARILFKEFRHRMLCLEVDDPGILRDVDTPEDYTALVQMYKGG